MKMLCLVCAFFAAVAASAAPTPEAVKAITKKVADWQIRTFDEHGTYRAVGTKAKWQNRSNYDDLIWHMGALYAGMNEWRKVSDDAAVEAFLMNIGSRNGWTLRGENYNADNHAVGQFYLSLYDEKNDPAMLKPTQAHFDWILANRKTGSLMWSGYGKDKDRTDCHVRWGWCDALFMAPPVWARLAKVTGERKYLDFMDEEYHATAELLWDNDEQLFFRDTSFFKRREKNGEKVFWARGNGWVFGGLALMIPDLPADWDGRAFYVDTFKQMAETIKTIQRPDGTWSMGLLGGVEGYPNVETSGTSFFAFGLAWGINHGILDRATYEPVVLKAWSALSMCVRDDGLLGYVQPVGVAPGESFADKSEVFGVGAFLAAGSEVCRLVGGTVRPEITTFMKDTGWCWYEDPRAIIHNGKLVVGGISGQSGDVRVGVFDLESEAIDGATVLYPNFHWDDHNSPVFHVRPDGSLVTVYAKHGKEKIHHYHISAPNDYMTWGPRKEFHHKYEDKRGVTYMNLYTLKDEGRLYCFFRDGQNFNPAFIRSADNGQTWGDYTHLITHDIGSRQRPYARYAQVDENTVGISFTDAHPRQYGNSLYYAEFRNGSFYNVDGTKIKDLSDGPLVTVQAEKIYKGSEVNEWKGNTHSVTNAAWTVAIESDSRGNPHIGYSVYHTHSNHHYRVASWDGEIWNDRQIAFGGNCLYDRESSYTGLMAFDPENPERIYISTDVNPSTGEFTGGVHEIYTAEVGSMDDVTTIQWQAITKDSKYKNIRPIVVSGGGYTVLMWLGNKPWTHFQNYETDAVGLILKRP